MSDDLPDFEPISDAERAELRALAGQMCGRCYDAPVELYPTNCLERPELFINAPLGQYHCPECGAMIVANMPHFELCARCLSRRHPAFDPMTGERVLFCGDRHWRRWGAILAVMMDLRPSVVIEGEAPGADRMSRDCANVLSIPVDPYPAKWRLYGKAAGPIRNREMLNKGRPHRVVAFHDDLTRSKGTRDMCEIAIKAGLPVRVIGRDCFMEFAA